MYGITAEILKSDIDWKHHIMGVPGGLTKAGVVPVCKGGDKSGHENFITCAKLVTKYSR